MYTAGLAPFYASNFSLWSAAYCGPGAAACFPLEAGGGKKPSFCIADILHAGGAEAAADSLPGASPASLAAHLGAVPPRPPFHAAGSPLRPTPVVAPDPAAAFPSRLSPLPAAYHPQHHAAPQHRPAGGGARLHGSPTPGGGAAPAPSSKDLKFGIDRILSAEFDPKVKEGNTLRGREPSFSRCHLVSKHSRS